MHSSTDLSKPNPPEPLFCRRSAYVATVVSTALDSRAEDIRSRYGVDVSVSVIMEAGATCMLELSDRALLEAVEPSMQLREKRA